MSKFKTLYEQIKNEIAQPSTIAEEQVVEFDTVKEAQQYCIDHFQGHSKIFSIDGKIVEQCRCMKQAHEGLNMPKIVVRKTLAQIESEYDDELEKAFKQMSDKSENLI